MTQSANDEIDDAIKDLGAWDYVIVGAGSAGSALAARLSEDGTSRVCLLEAGPKDTHPLISIPMGFAFWPDGAKQNWAFDTLPQKHLNNRVCYQPRGRVLGGSSAINAMIYIRGVPSDYDGWARDGATGWSWTDVFPYFKKSEGREGGATDRHGGYGPLTVSPLRYKNALCDRFLDAAEELQIPLNADFNGDTQEGAGYYDVTQRAGRRCSAARAYLEPARERENLRIITDAHAERVVIKDNRATAVVLRTGSGAERALVRAEGEVILSAGAFQSPQLLMLSGVGPAAHLKDMGVRVVKDAPNVGGNLQDHLDYTAIYKTSALGGFGLTPGFIARLPFALFAHYQNGNGPLSSNVAEAGAFLKTRSDLAEPDIQLHFIPGIVDDHGRKKHWGAGFTCHVCVLRPKSRGTVRLASPDPHAPPAIDPNFLSHPDDLTGLIAGAREMQRIMAAPALAAVRGDSLYAPIDADDETLIADIRARSDTIYHPVGTCRMGSDDAAVLDPNLRVKGVDALRVVDASVMPRLIGGNTNAPSIMIGEKAADLILAA